MTTVLPTWLSALVELVQYKLFSFLTARVSVRIILWKYKVNQLLKKDPRLAPALINMQDYSERMMFIIWIIIIIVKG